jgi:anti-sigma B factor antagonist
MTAQDFNYDLEVLEKDGAAVLSLAGPLDAHTFDRLEALFNELFEKGSFKLIVDMSGVDYVSSAGVGAFFNALSVARENNGNMVFLNLAPNVRELFNSLGLESIFTVADGRAAALRAL